MTHRISVAGSRLGLCMWHHQNTTLSLRSIESPLWSLSMALSQVLTPPSILLLVAGGGPSAVSPGPGR